MWKYNGFLSTSEQKKLSGITYLKLSTVFPAPVLHIPNFRWCLWESQGWASLHLSNNLHRWPYISGKSSFHGKRITKKTSVKVSFQHIFGSSMEKAKNPSIQGDFQQDLRATIGQSKTYPFSAKKNTNQTRVFAKICQLSSIHCRILTPEKIIFKNTLAESFISTTGALVVLKVSEVWIHPSSQHFFQIP